MNGLVSISNKFSKRDNKITQSYDKPAKAADKPSWNKYTSKPIQTKDKYDDNAKLDTHTKVIAHISESSK